MQLLTFDAGAGPRAGALVAGEIADLSEAAPSVDAAIERGREFLTGISRRLGSFPRIPAQSAALRAPFRPSSLRDFLAFEEHARRGAERRGVLMDPAWYEIPIYYKGNHRQITGPGEDVRWPAFTKQLDFECEIACVLGARGHGFEEKPAADAIAGYTIMNDWSARDLQRKEMATRLGPAKSKDFATSLGPVLVTADEVDPRDGLAMIVRVNGREWSRGNTRDMHWTFPQMIAYVSEAEETWPGDVYGSGTPYGLCGLDLDRWIEPGDTVEAEIEGLGVLANRVVPQTSP